jgi:hypothetical protein
MGCDKQYRHLRVFMCSVVRTSSFKRLRLMFFDGAILNKYSVFGLTSVSQQYIAVKRLPNYANIICPKLQLGYLLRHDLATRFVNSWRRFILNIKCNFNSLRAILMQYSYRGLPKTAFGNVRAFFFFEFNLMKVTKQDKHPTNLKMISTLVVLIIFILAT